MIDKCLTLDPGPLSLPAVWLSRRSVFQKASDRHPAPSHARHPDAPGPLHTSSINSISEPKSRGSLSEKRTVSTHVTELITKAVAVDLLWWSRGQGAAGCQQQHWLVGLALVNGGGRSVSAPLPQPPPWRAQRAIRGAGRRTSDLLSLTHPGSCLSAFEQVCRNLCFFFKTTLI